MHALSSVLYTVFVSQVHESLFSYLDSAMKHLVLVVVICVSFGSCWGGGGGDDVVNVAGPEPGFNYFVLAFTWPNQFCLSTKACNPPYPRQYFTIHGLFPHFTPTTSPQYCNTTQELTDAMLVDLKNNYELLKYWPDLKNAQNFTNSKGFWIHEWQKHGTCSANKFTPLQYFQRTIDLAKNYSRKISQALKKKGVKADGGKYQKLDVLNAVVEATGAVPFLSLSSGSDQALLEIRLCVKDDAVTLFNCQDETITLAAAPPRSSPGSGL